MNTTQGSQRKRALLAIPLAVTLFLLYVAGAEAHAGYLRSEPGQGAVVAIEPKRVDIWFTQDLFRRQGENWIRVFGPDEREVHQGDAQIDDDDRRHLWVALQSPVAPGEYRVEWHSLSAEDGDDEEGEFTFTLDPQAQVTSTPMLAVTETPFPNPTTNPVAVETLTPVPPNEPTPDASNGERGCALGLSPALTLVALGFGLKRKRK